MLLQPEETRIHILWRVDSKFELIRSGPLKMVLIRCELTQNFGSVNWYEFNLIDTMWIRIKMTQNLKFELTQTKHNSNLEQPKFLNKKERKNLWFDNIYFIRSKLIIYNNKLKTLNLATIWQSRVPFTEPK